MILIDVHFRTTPQARGAFIELLRATMASSTAEAGCMTYRFMASLDDENSFHLLELWESERALVEHLKGPAFKNFMNKFPGLGKVVASTRHAGALVPYEMPKVS